MKAITWILLTTIVLTGCKKEKDEMASDNLKMVKSITLTGYEDQTLFVYDNKGRISQVLENWGTIHYTYESNKVLILAKHKNKDADRYKGDITLDAQGRFSKAAYEYFESGSKIDYTWQYNAEGHCNKVIREVEGGLTEIFENKFLNGDLVQTTERRDGALYKVRKYTYYAGKPYKFSYDNRYSITTCNPGMTGQLPAMLVKDELAEDASGKIVHKASYSYEFDNDGYVTKEIISYPLQNEILYWNYGYK